MLYSDFIRWMTSYINVIDILHNYYKLKYFVLVISQAAQSASVCEKNISFVTIQA